MGGEQSTIMGAEHSTVMGAEPSINSGKDTIITRVQFLAETFPDLELFVFYNGANRDVYTSRRLYELAGKFANRLRHRYGFKRNDVIVNTLPNSPERVITSLGTMLAGCVDMNGQTLLADGDDFFHSARKSRCNGVILCPNETSPAWKILKIFAQGDSCDNVRMSCDKAPEMTSAILVSRQPGGKQLLEDLRTSNEDIFVEEDVTSEDIATVLTTSGSSGYFKLVPRTHGEIMEMFEQFAKHLKGVNIDTSNKDSHYNDRLLGWLGGYPFATYVIGKKRVLLDHFVKHSLRSGADAWHAIYSENCTFGIMLPLDIDNLVRHVTSMGGASFKFKSMVIGGQPIRKSQIRQAFLLAEKVTVGYGSTEAGHITQTVIKDPNAEMEDYCCGPVPEHISIKILDDNGQECKPRQPGLVVMKGIGVFKHYFNRLEDPDPNTIAAFDEDGYFNSEDVGYTDEKGRLFILGRRKDIIMYGGFVFYPGWLEAKIMEHPGVAETCVVPVSDPVLCQNICVCVQPSLGSHLTKTQLMEYCEGIFADKEEETTPLPKFYLILDQFPQMVTGKPDRPMLRKMAEEKFGVRESD